MNYGVGPVYVCTGETVHLWAEPYPGDYTNWPDGTPTWDIVEQPPGADATITVDPVWADEVDISDLTLPGNYVIEAYCGDYDPGEAITVTVLEECNCTDYRPCTPVEKDGVLYTIGQPITDLRIIRPWEGLLVGPGSTITVKAKPGDDIDCKIVGLVKDEIPDKIWMRWSDNTGRASWVAFPGGYHGWSSDVSETTWLAPTEPGSYTISCRWRNAASDCYYQDEDSDIYSKTVQVIDFCSMTSAPGELFTRETNLGWFLLGDEFIDDCGHRAYTKFNGSIGCWEVFYNDTIVGRCIWDLGHNICNVWYTDPAIHGVKRIVKIKHSSKNDSTSDGEGHPGFYCYICSDYDALSESFVYKQWRGKSTNPSPDAEMWKDEATPCDAIPADSHHVDLEF